MIFRLKKLINAELKMKINRELIFEKNKWLIKNSNWKSINISINIIPFMTWFNPKNKKIELSHLQVLSLKLISEEYIKKGSSPRLRVQPL